MTKDAWPGTLAGSTIVDVEDTAREIEAQLGLRPYSVHIVRVRFSGGRRADGVAEVVQDVPILPIPDVLGLDGVTRVVTAAQVMETGQITVAGISGRYTEDQLAGVACDGSPASTAERVFWEVAFLAGGCTPAGARMRFQVVGHPAFDAERGSWRVTLERAHADRTRDGGYR